MRTRRRKVYRRMHVKQGCTGFARAKYFVFSIFLSAIATTFLPGAYAQSLVQNRIAQPIRSGPVQLLRNTVSPKLQFARDEGALSGGTRMENMWLVFRRTQAQEADLHQLLQQQQTPGSPLYHHWLKPGEFAARYGVSPQDLAWVEAWLTSNGFQVEGVSSSRDSIQFSGTAAQVEAAFQTRMHRYEFRGQSHWANATDISLPQALAGVVLDVRHLNTFRPRAHSTRQPVAATPGSSPGKLTPHYTLSGNGQEFNLIAPADAQTIYNVQGLYQAGFTGNGQTLAVVGQTDITQHQNDIKVFRALSGLDDGNLPQQIVVPNTGAAVVSAGDLTEADIDVEWSGAIAKDAKILYVTSGGSSGANVFDALFYAIQAPLLNNSQYVPVISLSYGFCEAGISGSDVLSVEQVFEQANAQGQTIVAASGDEGSADCDYSVGVSGATHGLAVDYPGSSQYVTSVGGTSFSGDIGNQSRYWNTQNSSTNGSAQGYIPETTWNDTSTLSGLQSNGQLAAGGGGTSSFFTKPSWQTGNGVPQDGKRDVPDISLASDPGHDGYVLCTEADNNNVLTPSCVYPLSGNEVPYFDSNNQGYLWGGTSIAAPQVAAMITLWNQKSGNTAGVGNANPIFYSLAANNPAAFHDVITGSNAVVCQQGSADCISSGSGYVMSCCSAGSGYDLATGLGSMDANAMGAVWPSLPAVNAGFSLLLQNPAISLNPGGSQSTNVVLSSSGAGPDSQAGFSGTVNLTCSNLPTGVTCSFAPGAAVNLAAGQQQSVTLTLTATSSAAATTTARRSNPAPLQHWPMPMAFAGIFGLSLLGLGKQRRRLLGCRTGSRWLAMALLAGGLAAATALTACGGGSAGSGGSGSSPAPVTQTITVTGTSGTTIASAKIQLTVT